jgi:NADPH oxidase 2
MLNEEMGPDPITGLKAKTLYGRPNLDKLFQSWTSQYNGKSIGLFYCGPKHLGRELKWKCIKNSSEDVAFKFHEEFF